MYLPFCSNSVHHFAYQVSRTGWQLCAVVGHDEQFQLIAAEAMSSTGVKDLEPARETWSGKRFIHTLNFKTRRPPALCGRISKERATLYGLDKSGEPLSGDPAGLCA